jgi:hypothetical protein
MTQPCPQCGSPNEGLHKFCSTCGARLSSEPSAPQTPSPPDGPDANNLYTIPPQGSAPASYSTTPALSAENVEVSPTPITPSYVVKRSESDFPVGDTGNPAPTPTLPMSDYQAPAPAPYTPPPAPNSQQYTGYQGYAAGASSSKEGATYAPYTPESVAVLEKPKDQRSWLMPVIAVAAVVLLALVAVSGYLVLNTSENQGILGGVRDTSATQSADNQLPVGASEEDKVRAVIGQSNENQIKAWKDLDEQILHINYTGQALRENIDMVRQLKANSLYAIPVNERLDILDVTIDGDRATAHTLEVWTVTFYSRADNEKFETRPAETLEETYYLVKQDGAWRIERLTIDEQTSGTPQS